MEILRTVPRIVSKVPVKMDKQKKEREGTYPLAQR